MLASAASNYHCMKVKVPTLLASPTELLPSGESAAHYLPPWNASTYSPG